MDYLIKRQEDGTIEDFKEEIKSHVDKIRRKGHDIVITIYYEGGRFDFFEFRVNAGDTKLVLYRDGSTTIPQMFKLDDALEMINDYADDLLGYRVYPAKMEVVLTEIKSE